ncbi:signal transduction histidine kinase [Kitasatospora sp. GAS204A]|uniref:sensor histidine kinase n=1 Tax=unclassified Kitasatospora TaxID=2633591 RepID=UPI0024746307|nr:nitrate- and nitrite sensing domain-containing protein [Kitasatospora sp. GAS204B]MDH6119967.1 signal transduction histidine kinase [Kitasatospora sp. GAS204B]
MRLRSSSIRAKIIALLLVPIVALVSLWAYATLVTTSDFWNQLNVASTYKAFGAPVDQVVRDLQGERRTAVVLLARPQASDVQSDYLNAQKATDQDLAALRQKATGAGSGRLNGSERARLQDLLNAASQLTLLRGQVGQQSISWGFAITQYSGLIQPAFDFRAAFVSQQNGQLPRQGTILIELTRAREYLSQQDAAMEGLLGTQNPILLQEQAVLDPMHDQQALFQVYIGELDQPDQGDYLALQGGDDWRALDLADREFQSASEPADAVASISEPAWRTTADHILDDLAQENSKLADSLGTRATAYAMGLLWRGAIAGVVGLLAIALSVVVSLRIGRGLARELIGLRNAAHELAAVRLPSVMLRLRDGQPVDIAAEAPDLQFGDAEIGQVGRAFNQVQRTAVRAAVEQAELRRGVSAVFVNLARRSQVLLHRQLTLLDTMERRTEDPAELEDLFKLDHLTTRMRRHAEGLIILSGGSPGRAWRKPVRMVDVVRAAVGEVEDYARVIVRPFPSTGLLGSAVADVTHLIAELVENAAVFSPPQTQVTVQGEVVAHGFALEIDDRGLGLSEPALVEINQRLEVEQAFDLTDTDRLGLFVVSRLARRHGIRVSLRASPYGGTTAVVLIPRELLAEVPGGALLSGGAPAGGASDGVSAGGGSGAGSGGLSGGSAGSASAVPRQRDLVAVAGGVTSRAGEPKRGVQQRAVTGPQPAGAEPARTPGGLPRRRASGGPVLVPASGGTGRHRRQDTAPDLPGADDASADVLPQQSEPAAGGLLPRRVRQANLAPQLKEAAAREADRSADRAGDPQAARERSPEEARATFSSFQRGFSRGRATPSAAAPPPAGSRPAAPAVPSPGTPGSVGVPPFDRRPPLPDARRALAASPVPPALPAAPRPAPPAPAEGPDR